MRPPTADAMSELAPEAAPPPLVPLLPPLVLAAYFACVAGAGALANCALVAALLKRSTNGLFSIIIQLAVADFTLTASALGPELWSSNTRSWIFGTEGCMAYRGLNVLASTASLYLVATIALHTLATVNLEAKTIIQRNKRRDRDEDEEIRSSRHSLVNSDTSTPPRTMNVDYRLNDIRVPIAPPTIFVWVLSISLSIPEFALATTVRVDQDRIVCTLVDSSHKLNMQSMLAVFNLFLPAFIMTSAAVLIIIRLKSKKLRSQIDGSESVSALKLSLWLIFINGVFCSPRSAINFYNIYSSTTGGNDAELSQKNNIIPLINLICSAAYLAATLIRPLMCIILMPQLRKVFSVGFRNTNSDDV